MGLLFLGVLQEFLLDGLGEDAGRNEVVASVAQHAHQFGGERRIQQLEYRIPVGIVAGRNGALLDVLAGRLTQFLQ